MFLKVFESQGQASSSNWGLLYSKDSRSGRSTDFKCIHYIVLCKKKVMVMAAERVQLVGSGNSWF